MGAEEKTGAEEIKDNPFAPFTSVCSKSLSVELGYDQFILYIRRALSIPLPCVSRDNRRRLF